jgi:ATP-binding cassette subfamily B protein/subfamily B ATP-binding cassette protein MsbA
LSVLAHGDTRLAALMLSALGVLLLFAVGAACEALATIGWTLTGRRITYSLGETLLMRFQRRSLKRHAASGVGETLARVADDSWVAYRAFDELLFKPAQAFAILILILVLMAQLDGALGLAVLVISAAMVATSTFASRRLRGTAERARQLDGQIRSHVQQTLSGIAVVQAFGREADTERDLRGLADEMIKVQQKGALLKGASGFASGLVGAAGTGLVLWMAAEAVLAGRLSLGGMLVFLAYLRTSQIQLAALIKFYPAASTLVAIAGRVNEALLAEPEVSDEPGAPALAVGPGRVELDSVSFGYEPGRPVLRGVSLVAEPGSMVALVGATGAGKTTLAGLIPRFFDPEQGRVLIDGQDIRRVQLASLRRQVSLVLQEPFLFPVSIAENIGYGRAGASLAEIEAAAKAARAHDFITALPDGYDTVLGERGATLSGGERQRVSIARALLKDAPILILDEPTSALDSATEALILEALETLIAGRTTFVIAHRLSTIRQADRIALLDQGRIVETGTHDTLCRQNGAYARLVAMQSGADPRQAVA